MTEKREILALDASVIIDYQRYAPEILVLAHKHIGEVSILRQNLKEAENKGINCEQLNFKVISPTVEQLQLTANKQGRLSMEDRLLLLVSSMSGYICVTNDKQLYRECKKQKVKSMRGLRLMITLVSKGVLDRDKAKQIAKEIGHNNLRIHGSVIEDFNNQVDSISAS